MERVTEPLLGKDKASKEPRWPWSPSQGRAVRKLSQPVWGTHVLAEVCGSENDRRPPESPIYGWG